MVSYKKENQNEITKSKFHSDFLREENSHPHMYLWQRLFPISVILVEHPIVMGIPTIYIGTLEHRRFNTRLH